jgi:hypothetical protein
MYYSSNIADDYGALLDAAILKLASLYGVELCQN